MVKTTTALPAAVSTQPRSTSGRGGGSGPSPVGQPATPAGPVPSTQPATSRPAVSTRQKAGFLLKPAGSKLAAATQGADGIMFGLVAYAVTMAYLKNGWPGVKQWGAAKFFNQPTQGTAAKGVAT